MHKIISVSHNIELKELALEDSVTIYNAIITNKHFLGKWLPFIEHTNNENDTTSFIEAIVNNPDCQQEIYTIWFKKEFAGLIGLKDIDHLNSKVEIGYWLIEKHTKKGIIITSVKRITDYIFNELKLNRIQIKCAVGNNDSSAIPKKLGFTYEGIEREGERHATGFYDLETYSKLYYE